MKIGETAPISSRNLPLISRRSLLRAAAATTLLTMLRSPGADAAVPRELRLVAKPGKASLVGENRLQTDVWTYDAKVPGPTLRLRQGEPVRITVENRLDEDTTIHWHGIRLPNAMDGVPGLTQPPIKPGESFVYEFTPPDAGTFWYHPHANSLQQIGRGLAGALIVEEAEPIAVDRDLLWMLMDWRLDSDAQIAPGFGNAMEAAMSGRIGNTVTLNGVVPADQPVTAGERIRLRLVNATLARIMALRIEEHSPVIVAIDGQPCEPHEPANGRLLLGPAMRIDVLLDMQAEPGRRYRVIDDFYPDLGYTLTALAYEARAAAKAQPPGPLPTLPRNSLLEPDLAAAERHELVLQGGMMGGGMTGGGMTGGGMTGGGMMGGGMMGGGMMGDGMGTEPRAIWAINGMSMTGDGHAGMAPLLTLLRGRSCALTLRNATAWWHPMHFHGHSFRLLTRNGLSIPHRQWGDTVLIPPQETVDVAFVADNPGDWMLHCHVTDHQMAGLMTVLRVT